MKYDVGYGYGHIYAIIWSVVCWLLCSEGWKVRGVVVGVTDCCVMTPPHPTTIGTTNHYTAHLPHPTTQQPTQHAPADSTNVSIPIANVVLHPVTGAAQNFRELINDTTTQKNWIQSNSNEVACFAQV